MITSLVAEFHKVGVRSTRTGEALTGCSEARSRDQETHVARGGRIGGRYDPHNRHNRIKRENVRLARE
jgi:hypothetical protein